MVSSLFKNPLFIDIETVSCVARYEQLDERLRPFWERKAIAMGATTEEEKGALFEKKAGLFAEFGKVVAVALGYVTPNSKGTPTLHVKGLCHHDESILLSQLKGVLGQFSASRAAALWT